MRLWLTIDGEAEWLANTEISTLAQIVSIQVCSFKRIYVK